ncbi:MAG: glycosyltransferase family 2 protein [Burkholderiales bacterium]|nr:glycosyltransferase family 2 protein [Burkholderiales bacterium]
MNKSISVIIPNYNYARFLQRRIDSIVNQTVKPAEVIFLDDCSTDDSLIVAEQILSKLDIPYRIIPNETNQGVFKQWLKGIELAQYDNFWIAEADDYCELNFLETLLPAFNDKDVVMSYCDSYIINNNGDIVYDDLHWKNNFFETDIWSNNFIKSGKYMIENFYSIINVSPNASAIVFNKNSLKLDYYNCISNYKKIGDWLFYIIYLSHSDKAKLAYYSNRCNYHVRHDNNVTTISRNDRLPIMYNESLSIYQYCFDNFFLPYLTRSKIYNFISEWLNWYNIDDHTNELLFSIIKKDSGRHFFKTIKQDFFVYTNENSKYLEENKNLTDKNNILIKEIKGLVEENRVLLESNKNLQRIYSHMLKSYSWKFTKPLRLLSLFFRKLINGILRKEENES